MPKAAEHGLRVRSGRKARSGSHQKGQSREDSVFLLRAAANAAKRPRTPTAWLSGSQRRIERGAVRVRACPSLKVISKRGVRRAEKTGSRRPLAHRSKV